MLGVILMVTVTLTVLFVSGRFFSKMEDEIHRERCYYISRSISQIAEKSEIIIKNQWQRLDGIAWFIGHHYVDSKMTVCDAVSEIRQMFVSTSSEYVFIDPDGFVYGFGGECAQMKVNVPFMADSEQQVISFSPDDRPEEYMMFVHKLPNTIDFGNIRIAYVASLREKADIRDIISYGSYQGKNSSVLLDHGGNRFYYNKGSCAKSDFDSDIFGENNVIKALSKTDFLYGDSFEEFADNFSSGGSETVEIKLNGEDYFIGYAPIGEKWMFLSVIPEEYVSENISGVSDELIRVSVIFGGMLIFAAMTFILTLMLISWREKKNSIEHDTNEKLKKAAEETEKANKVKSEFLSHISHDIRTPINGIIGLLDIADMNRNDNAKLIECVEKMRSTSVYLLSLINDVLDMSKAQNGVLRPAHETFDLRVLLDECVSMLETQVSEKKLRLRTFFSDIPHRMLTGSPLYIRQVLLNILNNAVKYTDIGGVICFMAHELSSDGKNAVIEFVISDSGRGMSEEYLVHIFEPFTRERNEPSADESFRGTGLGMSIAKSLTDVMGGTICAESKAGEGSRFTVTIPLVISEKEPYAKAESEKTRADIRGMHILVAEDVKLNMDIVTYILEHEGAEVICAEDGETALRLFSESAEGSIDLILMDIRMPGINGYEAAERIRAMKRSDADIPIIAMTANVYEEDIERAKKAGMNDHLAKPMDSGKLLAMAGAYCAGRGQLMEEQY